MKEEDDGPCVEDVGAEGEVLDVVVRSMLAIPKPEAVVEVDWAEMRAELRVGEGISSEEDEG